MSGGSDQDCIDNYSTDEEWKCSLAPVRSSHYSLLHNLNNIPQYAVGFLKTPIYIINSIYDELILDLIVGLKCLPPSDCSEEDTKIFENYRTVGRYLHLSEGTITCVSL